MAIEFLLTTITLIVAIIGTLLRDPSRRVKAFLICLAAAASAGSAVKAVETERDKRFIQTALVSSLNPSNSAYEKLCEDIGEFAKAKGYDEDLDCPHMSDGMVTLSPPRPLGQQPSSSTDPKSLRCMQIRFVTWETSKPCEGSSTNRMRRPNCVRSSSIKSAFWDS